MFDVNEYLSPHFQLWEFLFKRSTEGLTPEIYANLKKLAQRLEVIRHMMGDKPIHIDSGFRTVEHNIAVGGVKDSQHLLGKAADIIIMGVPPHVIQHALYDIWEGGLGCYGMFTHVDIRLERERWSG